MDLFQSTSLAMSDIAIEWKNFIREGTNVSPILPSTIESKRKSGSITPEIPLIEFGDMINSIDSEIEILGENEVRGIVYGSNEKWPYHEYGLGVPERSTLRPVWDINIDEKLDQIFDDVFENARRIFSK
jgi:hypothetical protein